MNALLQYAVVAGVFVGMIVLLVGFHELGHYLFARLFGAGVEEFSIGVGRPKLLTWLRRRHRLPDGSELTTEFTIRAWPIGGFVRLKGMEILEDGSEVAIPGGIYSLAAWKRFAILLAGPVFSLLLGVVMLTALYSARGVMRQTTTVYGVQVGSPAERAGLRAGDRIVRIGGRAVTTGYAARTIFSASGGASLPIEVERASRLIRLMAAGRVENEPSEVADERGAPTGERRRQTKLGIIFRPGVFPTTAPEALGEALTITRIAAGNVGRVFSRPAEAKENVGGVISMVAATNAVVSDSIESTIQLAALLSISVGLFNLLPIPPLDGGQMLIALIEMLRRGRRLPMRAQLALLNVGAALLLAMVGGFLVLDVSRFFFTKPAPSVEIARPNGSRPSKP